jgi:hypothetical protein
MLQRAEFAFMLACFLSLQIRNQLTCHVKTNCFHFVEIDNRNNKSDIKVGTSYLGNGGESEKKKTFSAPIDFPNNLFKSVKAVFWTLSIVYISIKLRFGSCLASWLS